MKDELRRSEALRAAILQTSADGIVTMDAHGNVQDWNPAAARLFRYPREAALGRELVELIIPPEMRERYRQGLARHLTEGEPSILGRQVRLTALRADGTEFPAAVTVNRVGENGSSLFVAFIRDDSERHQYESALRESQGMFQDFMSHSPALAFVRDCEGRIVYVNAAYERFFGTTLAELQGKTLTGVVPQATALELIPLYERVLRENCSVQARRPIPSPDGQVHDCQFYLFPITTAAGERFLGGFALDVSEQSALENQLRQAQKMDAIGRLAGGVAHDFNNMLAVILGYGELLARHPELQAPGVQAQLHAVQDAAERAARLTRQLLIFSRKQVSSPQELDLARAVGGTAEMLRRLIGEDVELVALAEEDLGRVRMDPTHLEQILMNLAVNARDAMPEGGKLTIEINRVELDETYTREHPALSPGHYVRLAVSDSGCGMDPETISHIFEPFFTTKGVGEGTGLGLATVYGIVQQSGGHIQVYSELGRGTTFKIYLPLLQSSELAADCVPVEEAGGGTEQIWLVEDEEALRRLVVDVLEAEGYGVRSFSKPVDALEAAGTAGPMDLLLTDVVLPGMSGRELADRLQASRPDVRVLFMSGYTDDAVLRHGIQASDVEFIEKPFTPRVLTQEVRRILDGIAKDRRHMSRL